MKEILKSLVKQFFRVIPTPYLQRLIYKLVSWRVQTLSPGEALRFLFDLDTDFYYLQGLQAVAYGSGIHTKHRHLRYHDFFVERVQLGEKVLDIGCGIGAVAYDIAEKAQANVLGVDFSQVNIAAACQHFSHPKVSYLVGDALQSLPKTRFDVVILSNVLEHLPERPVFLRRVCDELHPSRILIRVPLFERDWRVPLKKEVGVEWRLDPTHETEYTLESFTAEMDGAGLTVVFQQVRWGEIWTEVVSR